MWAWITVAPEVLFVLYVFYRLERQHRAERRLDERAWKSEQAWEEMRRINFLYPPDEDN